jgi:hypothetical protein
VRDPAHGWTKKALEKAARKIELAQGWEIERSGRYVVTADGEILEKPREDNQNRGVVKLSQTARDIEAHTGEKSAERIGQEVAAQIIREAQSWEELHQKLGERGIAFERKGSGAVLRVGEVIIKASQAGRDMSLSKLVARLGEYEECGNIAVMEHREPEAVEKVEANPKVKSSWEDYQEAKTEYHATKKGSFSGLQKRLGEEREALLKTQRRERSALFRVSWRGKGAELNQRRSLMAAKQQMEKLDLRDRQRDEREALRKLFPRQFPSFKAWLNQEDDPELSVLFRYPGQPVLLPAEPDCENFSGDWRGDLRDYSPVFGSRCGGVMYRRKGGKGANVADFIDYGKKILIARNCGETVVLAALQLAVQKWGTIQVSGSKEYKRLCVQVAAKHNIRLANPELKAEIEAAREKRENGDVKPKMGKRMTFHLRESQTTLTGEVIAIDDDRGTATLRAGRATIPIISAKGYFTEAAPLEYTQTKEYAQERAKRHAGKNEMVYFARDERIYRGSIVEVTPTYAIQKTGADMATLHRLKDLEGFDEKLLNNQDVVIRKTEGTGIVCIEPRQVEKEKDRGWGR